MLVRVDVINGSQTAAVWLNTEAGWADMRLLQPNERGTILVAIGEFADFDAYREDCTLLAHLRWTPGPGPVTVVLSDAGDAYEITVNGGAVGTVVPRPTPQVVACSG